MTQLTTKPAEESRTELSPEVQVKDIGPARKRLTITIPAQAIDARLEQSMGTLSTQTVLPGFRKGRAPRQLLERRFGSTLRTEAKNQIVAEAYTKAIETNKISPIGDPEPDKEMEKLELTPGKAMTFSVEVEVLPEFTIPDLKGLEIRKPTLDISEKHIADETKRQLYQLGTMNEIKDGFKDGDRLTGRAVVHKDGQEEPFFSTDDASVVVPTSENDGRGTVLGLLIDGVDKLLTGKSVGDEITFKAVGPEAHEREDVRGAKLTIRFTVTKAHRIDPTTVQELVERFGLGTDANFREQIKMALEQRRDAEQAAAMREQVFEHLQTAIDFPLPEKLSEAQVSRNLDRQRIELAYRGMAVDQIEERVAEIRADTEAETRRRLKLMFILRRLADDFKLQVTEQEINGYIAAMASQRGERPAALKAEMVKAGQLNDVAMQIRDHKTADRIIAQAKVKDIAADEWNTFVTAQAKANAARRQAAGGGAKKAAAPASAKSEGHAPAKAETKASHAAPSRAGSKTAKTKGDDDDKPARLPAAKSPKKK